MPADADRALLDAVRSALAGVADPERAPAMQAYMRSTMPFLGVTKPARVSALRPVWAEHPLTDRATWQASVKALYDEAGHREERYAALALLRSPAARQWRDPGLVPLIEHLVMTGAWWDLVDEVAGRTVAPLHRAFPADMAVVIRGWSVHEDPWLRRTAILGQLGSKAGTDRLLLSAVVEVNASSPWFFHRKAIGWALRDLAHHDPDWVRAYLDEQGDVLSPLSRREAAKHL